MINIVMTSLQITIFIMAVLTFFGISIFVLFKYLMYHKQIENRINEILANEAKHIKKEFDQHKEEQIELFDETQKLANKIIDRLNDTEKLHTKNLKTIVDAINDNVAKIKELEDKIALRNNEIIKLQNKIREKNGIIARKTKQIQRLKDDI